jgi:hypothetical protein
MSKKINRTIRTHWYADDLLKQYPSKGDKYVIDEELQRTYTSNLTTVVNSELKFMINGTTSNLKS